MSKSVSFTEAIFEATRIAMVNDVDLHVLGLGVSYPSGADGTLGDLGQEFPDRVLDTPVSEAAVTGLALGAAMTGMPMIVHHGRVEFALFAIDQIATQAAKWNFMFGLESPLPLTVRVALGRQWGNGPQHTQHLPGLWGGITGLKVVVPSSPSQAARLMLWAVRQTSPVIYLEPRWLYKTVEHIDFESILSDLDDPSSRAIRNGDDFTLVGYGESIPELLRLARKIELSGESADVIDLVTINPIDFNPVIKSLKKTGRLVMLDMGGGSFSVASELVSKVFVENNSLLVEEPMVVSVPHSPVPTSSEQTAAYYPNAESIAKDFNQHFSRKLSIEQVSFEDIHLPPRFEFSE